MGRAIGIGGEWHTRGGAGTRAERRRRRAPGRPSEAPRTRGVGGRPARRRPLDNPTAAPAPPRFPCPCTSPRRPSPAVAAAAASPASLTGDGVTGPSLPRGSASSTARLRRGHRLPALSQSWARCMQDAHVHQAHQSAWVAREWAAR
jgi:hypothetical protein